MRGLLALALTAVLGLGLSLVSVSSGAEPRPRAVALAQVAAGHTGAHHGVSAGTGQERRAGGAVDAPGVRARDGEAVARAGGDGTASASAVARSVSMLGGRVTAYGARRSASATLDGVSREGRVEGLKVDGEAIGTVSASRTIPVPGAGQLYVNTGASALRLVLEQASGGLPAGAEVRVAIADAVVKPPRRRPAPKPTATATPTPKPKPASTPTRTATPRPQRGGPTSADQGEEDDGPVVRRAAPEVRKRLTAGGFAFPVYGDEVTYTGTFGAPRQPVIGTHQGTDIFAPFGTPVVAAADGRISRVGTLEISGNRLWLTSKSGDAFFYAHLSAFSPAAVNGAEVEAGTVLGFVGNTGDAEPTPPHLHFEVHPGGQEEPAVDPYPILLAWEGRRDVPADAWLQEYGPDADERPGALVAVRDFIAE